MVWCWLFCCRMWEGHTTDILALEGLSPVMELAVESWMAKLFGGSTLKPAAPLAILVASQLETDEAVVCVGAHEMFMDKDLDIAYLCCE